MDREKEKRLWAAFQHCSSSHKQNSRKKIYTHKHIHTSKKKKKISYYPNPCCTLGLCMCFLEYVCVCVWALLCLQDAQRRTGSLKSFGYKVKRARREMETKRREQKRESEREKREEEKKKREQDTTTSTKGGQAQQSVANSHFICVMLTVPSSYPLSRGKPRRSRESLQSDTDVAPSVAFLYFLSSFL